MIDRMIEINVESERLYCGSSAVSNNRDMVFENELVSAKLRELGHFEWTDRGSEAKVRENGKRVVMKSEVTIGTG